MPATIGQVLADAKARFASVSTSASLDAQLLLMEILGASRAHILAHPERPLTPEESARYEAYVVRRARGEPIAYILGRKTFYDRDFQVTPAVLIPRPETELLLEQALEYARVTPLKAAVDVGTGSGALAVTFAVLVKPIHPDMQVFATDLSPDALAVARKNAETYHADMTFLQGDLLTPLPEHTSGGKLDLIMANLPYIPSEEVPTLEVSRHEPTLALDGGADGLDLVRRLLAQAAQLCNPHALMLLEIGAGQGEAALEAVRAQFGASVTAKVIPDYAGLDRIVRIVFEQ